MLMLSGIKLPLMWAVRHRCTGCGCCHIAAVVRWCQTEERAWEDGDALVRWVMDGLFTLRWLFVDLLCAWGWAESELCWQCQMGASAGVMEKCDKRVQFTLTAFVPLVFHHHFLSPLVCGSAGCYPQPGGKKDI